MQALLIIKTGSTFPALREQIGDFEHWIERVASSVGRPTVTLDARQATALPDVQQFAGIIITGSHAMVSECEPWSEALVPWLRHAVALQLPLLGICYGHQLLAHALGGKVGFHPAGIEIGTVPIHPTAAALQDRLFQALPPWFAGQTVHRQSVLQLPPGAVLLAGNAFEPHHAFRVGTCAWGVQFHPEFGTAAMQGYIRQMQTDLAREGQHPEALQAAVTDTPEACTLLQRFCQP